MNGPLLVYSRCLIYLLVFATEGLAHGFVPLSVTGSGAEGQKPLDSPDGAWHMLDRIPADAVARPAWVRPLHGQPFRLTPGVLQGLLASAPTGGSVAAQAALSVIHLPMPDGSFARFNFVEAPVMAAELAAKFPEIRTYLGAGIDDPAASVRFDLTPAGFHAQILSPQGAVYIDPYSQGDTEHYTSTYKRDYARTPDGFVCLADTPTMAALARRAAPQDSLRSSGNQLRTYRLAVAATAEYTAFQGGTVAAGMAAIVTAINRVNGVYETELAIRLVLVPNNNLLVYTDPNTDPYLNGDGATMLNQNQANIDAVIGSANYDIGHVFSTAGGGIASVGVVCVSGLKARGVTGLSSPIGDGFYIDYVAHEMGHQFGANHSFNSTSGNCGGGHRDAATAYEPGGGSTIMAYAGICSPDDLQPHSDPYFHWRSYDEITTYVTAGFGSSCAVVTSTGNNIPSVSAGPNYTIPFGTLFTLTATGSDPDGDTLTYCWEESDLGPAQFLTDPDNGSSPLFRSFAGTADRSRTFPRLAALLNGGSSLGEKLPSTSRTMGFRVTARDNRPGGGGVNSSDAQITVTAGAGPFVVTSPNTAVTWGGLQSVTWDVAGTTNAPVNAQSVNILLSTDGGNTFPYLLASNTPNDGAELVLLPSVNSSAARIKVAAVNNIFFDVSAANFILVVSSPSRPTLDFVGTQTVAEGSTLTVTNVAHNPNLPASQPMFSLDTGAPAGASVTLTNGVFTWTPTETQGPSTNSISVIATYNGSPVLSATQTFVVIVTEVNTAPQLTPPANQIVYAGMTVTASASATDADLPANLLTFALEPGAPAGADINATNGLFTWTSGPGDLGTTNTVTVRVTDNGVPPLADTRSFTIAVVGRPIVESITATSGTVTLTWQSIAGHNYRVQFKSSLDDTNWTDLPGDVTASGPSASRSNSPANSQRYYRVQVLP